MPETERLTPDPGGIARAAALIRSGRLVAFPTETVYGLGGDARNARAVAAIFSAKGRPRFNPLIAHCADLDAARTIAEFPPLAERLAGAFWPGPLTLVLPRRPEAGLAELACAGLETVALRVPAHPLAAALLREVGAPVAAPSANPSGRVSPTAPAHVLDGLAGRIAAVIDGGACPVGLESTIISVAAGRARLLRPGGLAVEAAEAVLGQPLEPAGTGPVSAPGQLASHYAPGARLRLGADTPRAGEGWLGFGPIPPGVSGPALSLSLSGDTDEAAANLFSHLRALDQAMGGRGIVAVAPVPETGLGRAINDRLVRAAAPRG